MHTPAIAIGVACIAAAVLMALAKPKARPRGKLKKLSTATAPTSKNLSRFSSLRGPTADSVSVLSWNTLSPAYARPKSLPWASPAALSWHHRSPLIAAELRSTAADVVALQEVEGSRWPEMKAYMPGYAGILQDSGSKDKDKADDKDRMLLAIMWKPSFQLIWSESRSRALLVQLRWTDATGQDQDLWVVNVHLEGSPYRPNDRISQVRSALSRLTARQESVGCDPHTSHLVFCGDMNSSRGETVWRLLKRGLLEGGSTESFLPNVPVTQNSISHPYPLQDVYDTAGGPVPFTRKAPGNAASIDFIWASTGFTVNGVYDPLKGTRAPAASAGSKARCNKANGACSDGCAAVVNTGRALALSLKGPNAGLPNALCPSDHLPLGVVLTLRPRTGKEADTCAGASASGGRQSEATNGVAGEQALSAVTERVNTSATIFTHDDSLASNSVSLMGSNASLTGLESSA